MTVEEARARVQKVDAMSGDNEIAHGEEDSLREDVLEFIASGNANPSDAVELARLALSTRDIKFLRWYA